MNNGLDAAPGFCKTCSLQDKKCALVKNIGLTELMKHCFTKT